MNLFQGLFKAGAPQGILSRLSAIHLNTPQNATSGSAYRFLMGGTTAGKPVTERSAMQMTAVYSWVRVLAEAVAGLPLHLYTFTPEGGKAAQAVLSCKRQFTLKKQFLTLYTIFYTANPIMK